MADPRKPRPKGQRRPVVGSRNPTARPRSVAGRREDAPADESVPPPPDVPTSPPTRTSDEQPAPSPGPVPWPVAADEPGEDAPARRRASSVPVLVVALVVLVGVAALEGWYLWGRPDPTVSSARPVVIGEVLHRSAVETAQTSTEEILTYGYQDFDAQVDEAASMMTPEFAERFRDTAADVKDRFVRQRTEQEVRVVAASVVSASPEKVQALLFLDQYVIRPETGTNVTPYRALVTVQRDEGGWLVSEIETR